MKDWIWDIPKITMILLNFVFVLPLFMEIIKNLNLISMEFLLHFSVSIHPQQLMMEFWGVDLKRRLLHHWMM